MTRDLRFSGLIRRTFRLPLTTHKGMWRTYSNTDSRGYRFSRLLWHNGVWSTYSNPGPHGSPFSRFLQHTKRCGKSILNRILTGIPAGRVNGRTDFKVVSFNHPCNYGSGSGGSRSSNARYLIAWEWISFTLSVSTSFVGTRPYSLSVAEDDVLLVLRTHLQRNFVSVNRNSEE